MCFLRAIPARLTKEGQLEMNGSFADMKIFTGNSNRALAEDIAKILGKNLGNAQVTKFSDGEISVSLYETVRGCDCYIVNSTNDPVNDNLMEICIMMDAMRRASAGRITAVIPYYGYARQDRKAKPRDPITSKLVANILSVAGADRIITMDLHAAQIQGYFDIPVDHLHGQPILTKYYLEKKIPDLVVVSPDHGSVSRARAMAEPLDATLAIVDKRRPKANVSEVMNVIGDVVGKNVLLADDMIDTAGTICNAAGALKKIGAKNVFACCTHAVLSGPALQRINDSAIDELVVLDTIAIPKEKLLPKMKVLSVAPLLAESMRRIYACEPLSGLYEFHAVK
jgi:ribose-phosphate pyrophosphokinase